MQTVFITHPTHKFDTYFGQTALAQLQKIARVRCNPTQDDLEGEALLQHIEDFAVVIAYRQTPFDRQVLAAMQEVVAAIHVVVPNAHVSCEGPPLPSAADSVNEYNNGLLPLGIEKSLLEGIRETISYYQTLGRSN